MKKPTNRSHHIRANNHTHSNGLCSYLEQRCSALQHVAVCCSASQHVAVCCSVLQCVAVYCSVLRCVSISYLEQNMSSVSIYSGAQQATCCSGLQRVAAHFEDLLVRDTLKGSSLWQQVAVCCNVLQCVAVCCSDLEGLLVRVTLKRSSVWQRVAVRCHVLQCVAVCCSDSEGLLLRDIPFVLLQEYTICHISAQEWRSRGATAVCR